MRNADVSNLVRDPNGIAESGGSKSAIRIPHSAFRFLQSMRRIFAQTRKELTQIIRDWRTLLLALVLPLILLILNGSAISLTVNNLPIIVQDFDDSSASRELI